MSDKLIIRCPSNCDYDGVYFRKDTEDEILDLTGKKPSNEESEEWIEWVLGHCIDDADIDSSILEAISMLNVSSISYMSANSGMIEIQKY